MELIHSLEDRRVADGGFAGHPGGSPRADATCWATLALNAIGGHADVVQAARQALGTAQFADGRVCPTPALPNAIWPTPLAILAWHGHARHKDQRGKAVGFLLNFDQVRIADDPEVREILGHDPTIKGWPWIADTTPWLEPTAYCLLALRVAGSGDSPRAQEGLRLIMNRQLSTGGWNYGNTTVYGQEHRPVPETTGVALQAVAGLAARPDVAKSIAYLRSQLPTLRTPLTLAWAILGLASWREIDNPRAQITRIVDRQGDYTAWDTVSLSLLILAWYCPKGLLDWLQQLPEVPA